MAQTDELVAQAQAADTTDQLDAIQAASEDAAVQQAVANRRAELQQQSVTTRPSRPTAADRAVADDLADQKDPPKPKDHFFLDQNGKKINAYGEEKGSPEDKKRFA